MKKLEIGVLASVVSLVVIGLAAPAHADDSASTPDEVAAVVADAAPTSLGTADTTRADKAAVSSLQNGANVTLSDAPVDGVSVTSADGHELLKVDLPGAQNLSEGQIANDGSVTYAGDAHTPAVNVLAADNKLRVSVVIDSSAQPTRYDYDLGAGVTVELKPDGGATAYVQDTVTNPKDGSETQVDRIVGDVQAPWAVDATGAAVPTHYEVSGSTLTQVVEHGRAGTHYPVVADPTFDQPNWFQHRVRFNRAETSTIASGGAGILASVGCGAMTAVCVLAGSVIWWNASVADKSGQCVQLTATSTYTVAGMIWWVDQYSGGPCR
ncbi:hypothetical protein [Microbacterium sp. AG790]|uniref:hypothetical protein n=1 Tax=Microbacterium sp. AG790 TaxID=2183995 RepID=UPI000EB2A0E4|nr:hypothetical protein [Microbacterium sp. AG790]